jgi:Xaa-Pro aminopeptidase
LKEGLSEIEFGGMLEREAKKLGSEGLLRVRSMNYEAYSWHILAGPTGGIVSQSDSPMGGLGLSPAFPVGASRRPIQAHEPIVVDFGTCSQGYQADETRTFCIGKLPKKFLDAYEACHEIHNTVLSETRPGVSCEYLFDVSVNTAKKLGSEENYLGPPGLHTRFVGHGIGLELNESPFLAKGHAYELEEGMTFALEPKIVFPGEGAVGIENTVYVNRDGYEFVTSLENCLFVV